MSFWIDGHCHLTDPRLRDTLPLLLERARKDGIAGWVQGGVSPEDWDRQITLGAQIRAAGGFFATAYGLHPWWVAKASGEELGEALKLLEKRLDEPAALGEMGLDFGRRNQERKFEAVQRQAFEAQLRLSTRVKKPLVLHIVHAHSEALDILEGFSPFPARGLVHSFTGSKEIAERYIRLGFLISVSGAVTQEGFQTLKRALKSLPSDSLVVETDAPDQMPRMAHPAHPVHPVHPMTGTESAKSPKSEDKPTASVNEPAYLIGIADKIGEIRGVSGKEVLDQSTRNLLRLFAGSDEEGSERSFR